MQEIKDKKHSIDFDDEIDLRELFKALSDGKWLILALTTLVSIFGVIYSLYLPNIYKSEAILVPVTPSNNISGALGSYGGLAGLAGISLSSGDDEGNSVKALKKISSLSFFENNILQNIFLPDLMAVKYWDVEKNIVVYDDSIYQRTSNTWVRDVSYPKKQIPTAQESFEVFTDKHLNISQDQKTGFITLSIRHQSPFIARQWVELIINEVNNFYRQKDKAESEKAVNYLNQITGTSPYFNQAIMLKMEMTGLTQIKQVIAELLQEETQKLTLIEANQYYVFDYIDPPAVMERKSEPKRSIIIIIITLLGAVIGVFFVLLKHYVFKKS